MNDDWMYGIAVGMFFLIGGFGRLLIDGKDNLFTMVCFLAGLILILLTIILKICWRKNETKK